MDKKQYTVANPLSFKRTVFQKIITIIHFRREMAETLAYMKHESMIQNKRSEGFIRWVTEAGKNLKIKYTNFERIVRIFQI